MKNYIRPTVTPLGTVHDLTLASAKAGAFTDNGVKPFKKKVGHGS